MVGGQCCAGFGRCAAPPDAIATIPSWPTRRRAAARHRTSKTSHRSLPNLAARFSCRSISFGPRGSEGATPSVCGRLRAGHAHFLLDHQTGVVQLLLLDCATLLSICGRQARRPHARWQPAGCRASAGCLARERVRPTIPLHDRSVPSRADILPTAPAGVWKPSRRDFFDASANTFHSDINLLCAELIENQCFSAPTLVQNFARFSCLHQPW